MSLVRTHEPRIKALEESFNFSNDVVVTAGGTAYSILGNPGATTGVISEIQAATDGHVLRRSGTVLGFGLLVNANISASAAISGTKISPDFGAQQVVTTNTITGSQVCGNASATVPGLSFKSSLDYGFGLFSTSLLFIHAGTATYAITSSQFQGVAGTTTNPGFSSASDTNTGFRCAGSDVAQIITGGTVAVSVNASQAVTIGTGTATQHTFNTLLATNGAAVMTLNNGPAAATAGNPVGWVQITINGTTRYQPFW